MTIATQDRAFAEQKVKSAISLSEKIAAGDWPYLDSKEALQAIIGHFREHLKQLKDLDDNDDDDVIEACCSDARSLVARYHTFIGVILRSSNVRNAFEGFAPLRRMASRILGRKYKIIFSSEWSYTPFVYPIPIASLEKFVFVGLPSCEANNSLLIPLAGHELGHALWRQSKQEDFFKKAIRTELFHLFANRSTQQNELFVTPLTEADFDRDFRARSSWKKSYELAARHCEEVFCDVLGCWLFGEGFLHAFRYMLCPEVNARSAEDYPSNRSRAEYLDTAFQHFHGHVSKLQSFFPSTKSAANEDLRHADETTKAIVPQIIARIDQICKKSKLARPTPERKLEALERIRNLIPAEHLSTIADVINAGWALRFEMESWTVAGVKDDRKLAIIDDLVFKSLEINELETAK